MRNIIGSPVEGSDFFERPRILARLCRELNNLANILLVAPRRVGKTSLVIRLCKEWRIDPEHRAIFLNVEGRADEFAFAEKLIEELAGAGLNADIFTRAIGIIGKIRQVLGGKGIKIPGFEASLGEVAEADLSTLGKVLDSVFRKIDAGDHIVLIAIDELPEFLFSLLKSDDGSRRVVGFLHWLRELRQTYRRKIRWLFLGSIGLDNFVEDQKLQKLINDLQVFTLDAFSPEEADAFLTALGNSNKLPLDESQRREIVRLLGWPLAYYLHLIFHELLDIESQSISAAFKSLLQPQKLTYFDSWNERIDAQFAPAEAAACKTILRHLCQHHDGRTRDQILAELMSKSSANVDDVELRLARLLLVLQRDGYLLEKDSKYSFRSFLLREYWSRKYLK